MVYPACGLAGSLPRFLRFLGVLMLESFTAQVWTATIIVPKGDHLLDTTAGHSARPWPNQAASTALTPCRRVCTCVSRQALGLAVGGAAPSTEAAMAMGPAVMLVWIVFGGGRRKLQGRLLGSRRGSGGFAPRPRVGLIHPEALHHATPINHPTNHPTNHPQATT